MASHYCLVICSDTTGFKCEKKKNFKEVIYFLSIRSSQEFPYQGVLYNDRDVRFCTASISRSDSITRKRAQCKYTVICNTSYQCSIIYWQQIHLGLCVNTRNH
jgi:hypothetical protein